MRRAAGTERELMKSLIYKAESSRINRFPFNILINGLLKDTEGTPAMQTHNKKDRKQRYRTFAVLIAVIVAVLATAFSGCGSQQGSSSSAADSSSAEASASPGAPAAASQSSAPVSQQSSSQMSSAGEYALAAGSGSSSAPEASAGTAAQSAASAAPSASSAKSAAQADSGTNSQSVFQSVFGSDAGSEPGSTEKDTSGSKISMAEYNRIEDGMTYADVKSTIGGDGKIRWESGTKGSRTYTVVYRWAGSGSSGAYADLTFEDGSLNWKMQFSLE